MALRKGQPLARLRGWRALLPFGFRGLLHRQQRGQLLVQAKEKGDSCRIVTTLEAIGGIDGLVEFLVGLHQIGGHGKRVVKVCQRSAGVGGAGVEHTLGGGLDGGALLVVGFGPGKVVVDDAGGIAVVALQSPTHRPHPGVVHGGCENAEVDEGGV